MKNIKLLIVLLPLILLSCKKDSTKQPCINGDIEKFKANPTCNSGSSVKKYQFLDESVYVFESGNCGADLTSLVVDEECNHLGSLGGIAGNTEINGENFHDKAILEEILWGN